MSHSLGHHGLYLLGSSVRGVLQATILEWFTMTSSRGSFWPTDQTHLPLLHWQVGSLPLVPPGSPRKFLHIAEHVSLLELPWQSSVKSLCFHCRECSFDPWSGTKTPYAMWHQKIKTSKQKRLLPSVQNEDSYMESLRMVSNAICIKCMAQNWAPRKHSIPFWVIIIPFLQIVKLSQVTKPRLEER